MQSPHQQRCIMSGPNPTTAKQSAPAGTTAQPAPMRGSNKLYDVPLLEENGNNFAFWKYRVKMVLKLRKLWPLVDGKDKAPSTTSPDYEDWVSRDDEAHAQIALTLTD